MPPCASACMLGQQGSTSTNICVTPPARPHAARRLAAEFEEKRKQDRSEQGKAGRLEFVRPASGPDLTRLPAGGDLAAQMVATAKAAATAKASAAAAGAARRASKWDAGRK